MFVYNYIYASMKPFSLTLCCMCMCKSAYRYLQQLRGPPLVYPASCHSWIHLPNLHWNPKKGPGRSFTFWIWQFKYQYRCSY